MSLYLRFEVGEGSYLLDVKRIACVLPMREIRPIALAPGFFRGACEYLGLPVPVIDLSELLLGAPAARRLGTRLVLVSPGTRDDGPGGSPLCAYLGLIAEKATQLLRREAGEFAASRVLSVAAPFLGPVTTVAGRLLQRIEVSQLPGAATDARADARTRSVQSGDDCS